GAVVPSGGGGAPPPPIQRRERVLLRDEQVCGLDVVATRAAHAAHVPGVDDLDLRLRMEVGDPHVLVAVRSSAWSVAVEDLAGAVEQIRMHAATGEEPVAGDAIAAWYGDGPAPRVRRSGRDADRIAVEQRATNLGRELRALTEAVDPHREAPARRAVGARGFLDHAEGGEDVGAEPALRFGQRHLEQPGVGDLEDEIARELASGLDLVGTLTDARSQRTGDLERSRRCPCGVGGHGLGRAILRPLRAAVKAGRVRAALLFLLQA